MGEAKRRKAILGDSYGKPVGGYSIQLGDITDSDDPEIARISAEASREGIVNNGVAIPFVVSIDDGGKFLGVGFPSLNSESRIIVGLFVLKVIDLTKEKATPYYQATKNELRRRIVLAFKEASEAKSLVGVAE